MEINIMITQTRGPKVRGYYSLMRQGFSTSCRKWEIGERIFLEQRTLCFLSIHTRDPFAASCHGSLSSCLSPIPIIHHPPMVNRNPQPAIDYARCLVSSQVSSGENHRNTLGISESTLKRTL